MAFTPLAFTKDWTNASDFPTFEDSETQVRADMQYLFNEIKTYINTQLGLIAASGGAALVGAKDPDSAASTVQAELDDRVLTADYDPAEKTSIMTQSVGVDSAGKLWTAPVGSGTLWGGITGTLSDQSDLTAAIAAVETLANTKAKIATGSYTGTGTCGSANQNTLTFAFAPKVIFIQSPDGGFPTVFFSGGSFTESSNSYALNSDWGGIRYAISGNTVSWYNDGTYTTGSGSGQGSAKANLQLNKSGSLYKYLVIG